ncbi:hypothetical protein CSHISOI_02976, partial [Colletotrichum shisoi]
RTNKSDTNPSELRCELVRFWGRGRAHNHPYPHPHHTELGDPPGPTGADADPIGIRDPDTTSTTSPVMSGSASASPVGIRFQPLDLPGRHTQACSRSRYKRDGNSRRLTPPIPL